LQQKKPVIRYDAVAMSLGALQGLLIFSSYPRTLFKGYLHL